MPIFIAKPLKRVSNWYIQWLIVFCSAWVGSLLLINQLKGLLGDLQITPEVHRPYSEPFILRHIEVSFYTASANETDNSPCLTADGTNICKTKELVAASNCLPFGTIVEFAGKRYRVADKMHKRYKCGNIDLLTFSKKEARKEGRYKTLIKIF